MAELLGPMYPKNLAFIDAAYAGTRQVFERDIPHTAQGAGHGIATYLPHVVDGTVRGMFVLVTDVSAMKQLEVRLRESETRWREIYSSAPIGMGISPMDGSRILEANPAFCEFIGYTAEELQSLSVTDLTYPEDLHLSVQGMRRIIEGTADSYAVEKRYRRKDGQIVWGQIHVSALRSESSESRYLLFQVKNIDERKRAVGALEQTKERLALALEASQLSLWEFDIRTGRVLLDEHWAAMMGLPPGPTRTTDTELAARTHPDDLGHAIATTLAAFKGTTPTYHSEFRYQSASGSWRWIRSSGKVVERSKDGRAVRAVGTNLDITDAKMVEEQVRQMAFFDQLTNLPNRQLLEDRIQQLISQSRRNDARFAVLFIDLDKFKSVNDAKGHEVGDWLLRTVAQRMRETVRASDTVARIGGDEFVALLADVSTARDAVGVAEKLRAAIAEPYQAPDGETLVISASIGIVLFPLHGQNLRDLLRLSDAAMYQVKDEGKNAVRLYAP